MADIATISLKAETSDLERGTQKLKELGNVAEATSSSVDDFSQSVSKSANSNQQASKSLDNLNNSQKEVGKSMAQVHAELQAKANAYRDDIKNIQLSGNATLKLKDILNDINKDYKNFNLGGKAFVELEAQIKSAINITEHANEAIVKSFMDQIDATRKASSTTSDLTNINKQLAEARKEGNISHKDYLEILSQISRRTKQLSQEEQVNAIAKEAMMTKLKEQAFLYGASKTDIMAYRAAQLGIADEAKPVIDAIKKQEERTARLAQEQKNAVEEARKLAYEQRQEAIETARGQREKDSFIQSLKNQADAIGKTKTELLEMKAAQLGVSDKAAPFIKQLDEQSKKLLENAKGSKELSGGLSGITPQLSSIINQLTGGNNALSSFLSQSTGVGGKKLPQTFSNSLTLEKIICGNHLLILN